MCKALSPAAGITSLWCGWLCYAMCWGCTHSPLILHLFPRPPSHTSLANGSRSDPCQAHTGGSTTHDTARLLPGWHQPHPLVVIECFLGREIPAWGIPWHFCTGQDASCCANTSCRFGRSLSSMSRHLDLNPVFATRTLSGPQTK